MLEAVACVRLVLSAAPAVGPLPLAEVAAFPVGAA